MVVVVDVDVHVGGAGEEVGEGETEIGIAACLDPRQCIVLLLRPSLRSFLHLETRAWVCTAMHVSPRTANLVLYNTVSTAFAFGKALCSLAREECIKVAVFGNTSKTNPPSLSA